MSPLLPLHCLLNRYLLIHVIQDVLIATFGCDRRNPVNGTPLTCGSPGRFIRISRGRHAIRNIRTRKRSSVWRQSWIWQETTARPNYRQDSIPSTLLSSICTTRSWISRHIVWRDSYHAIRLPSPVSNRLILFLFQRKWDPVLLLTNGTGKPLAQSPRIASESWRIPKPQLKESKARILMMRKWLFQITPYISSPAGSSVVNTSGQSWSISVDCGISFPQSGPFVVVVVIVVVECFGFAPPPYEGERTPEERGAWQRTRQGAREGKGAREGARARKGTQRKDRTWERAGKRKGAWTQKVHISNYLIIYHLR